MNSYLVETGVIHISSIKDIECILLIDKIIHCFHIIHRGRCYMHKGWNLSCYIKKCVKFYPGFGFTKCCPPEYTQTQVNGRLVKRIDFAFNLKIIVGPFFPGNSYKMISKRLKYFAVSGFIGFCQITSCNANAEVQMIRFTAMGIHGNNQIPKTIPIGELTEKHTE